jgi:type III secretion system FlhB-like substrate exporter
MALVVGAKVSWTTARLVVEALDHGLHVVEDPLMIKLLGRTKFVDLVVFGIVGW